MLARYVYTTIAYNISIYLDTPSLCCSIQISVPFSTTSYALSSLSCFFFLQHFIHSIHTLIINPIGRKTIIIPILCRVLKAGIELSDEGAGYGMQSHHVDLEGKRFAESGEPLGGGR